MNKIVRLGTRESALAIWQAKAVEKELNQHNIKTEIVKIKSDGDLDVNKPLYEFGVSGIFTKSLDTALLNNKIDIAVHSLKDVPSKPAKGIEIKSVLKREDPYDVLVIKNKNVDFNSNLRIATSSVRRKCQWLYKFPNHIIKPIRGNIDTRLKKLFNEDFDGAVFALAGLKRLGFSKDINIKILEWMVPCASQGTIGIAGLKKNKTLDKVLKNISCDMTKRLVNEERQFISLMKGGCSKPISALALRVGDKIYFKTNICTMDAKKSISDISIFKLDEEDIAIKSYKKNIKLGAGNILKSFR